MIIDYIYIEKYNGIENYNLNFSSEISFSFDKEKNELTAVTKKQFIENFYGHNIRNITAIVGENGTGKSSVLDFINYELLFPKKIDTEAANCIISIFDYKKKNRIVVYIGYKKENIHFINKENIEIKEFNIQDFNKTNADNEKWERGIGILSASKLFNSSIFTRLSNTFDYSHNSDYGPKDYPILINLTTNFLLRFQNREYPVQHLNSDDVFKAINFVINSEESYLPSIKYPSSINLDINEVVIRNLLSSYYTDSTKTKLPAEVYSQNINYLNRIFKNIDDANRKKVFNKKEYVHGVVVKYAILELSNYFLHEDFLTILQYKASNYFNFFKGIKSILTSNPGFFRDEFSVNGRSKSTINRFLHDVEQYISSISELVDIEIPENKLNHRNIILSINEKSKVSLKNFEEKKKLDYFFEQITRYSWGNNLSSGEQALLYQYARLYDFYLKIENSTLDNIIMLIDEGELYMHPSWQLKYLSVLIDYINQRFNKFSVQIILTSHSPFIISDLLKENVLFLKNEDGKPKVSNLDEMEQTFGANVHLLFTDSFFMKEGTIGEYAQRKIEELIDLLAYESYQSIIEKCPDIEKRINMIGEPIIRNKLISMWNEKLPFGLVGLEKKIAEMNIEIQNLKKANVSNKKGKK